MPPSQTAPGKRPGFIVVSRAAISFAVNAVHAPPAPCRSTRTTIDARTCGKSAPAGTTSTQAGAKAGVRRTPSPTCHDVSGIFDSTRSMNSGATWNGAFSLPSAG